MLRLWFRVALSLTAALIMPVVAARALPHPASAMPAIFAPLAECPAPCFMGIRPGVTTLTEAIDQLRANAWVASVEVQSYEVGVRGLRGEGWLIWYWSDAHPNLIDFAYPGRIAFSQSFDQALVTSIDVHTTIRPYDFQQWFGAPDSSTATLNNDGAVNYWHTYGTHTIKAALECPAKLLDYWNSHAEMMVTAMQETDDTETTVGQGSHVRFPTCLRGGGWDGLAQSATGQTVRADRPSSDQR